MKTMKTKTDSFTKFITFCVLALFLFTNMILFSSCDNGNSPNDNTNEEQNNNAPTDYCKICDGVQTENCGIEHKCNDENCVEYADEKIYKNGHTHDYCENNDCDGSTHKNQAHPEYPTWFEEKNIGGQNSPYKAFVIDNSAYNETNDFTAKEKINDYLYKYIEYINNLTLNKELTGDVEINFDKINELGLNYKLDGLIGSLKDEPGTIFEGINGINDICAPAIEKFAEKICTNATNKTLFKLYYKAISNEAYRSGYNGEITDKKECTGGETEMEQRYIQTKKDCSIHDGKENIPFEYKYFYLENGELNPEVVQQFDTMVVTAADKLTIDPDEARNIINLSFTASSIEGMHDYLSSTLLVNEHTHTDECYNNEMYDIIDGINISKTTAKLNSSIFVQDFGLELC